MSIETAAARLIEQESRDLAAIGVNRAAKSSDSSEPFIRQRLRGADSGPEPGRTLVADAPFDALATPPTAMDAMFYGVLGELAREAADETEVNPAAAMASAMAWLSATMGRNTVIHVGNEWHHLRLYGLHVGRSSRGGKGMSLGLLNRIRKEIERIEPGLMGQVHLGGLSSREGLALFIHDGFREGKQEVPAVNDKRLFIVESEFANVLSQTKRDGNTLSAALRDGWDGVGIKPATKSVRVWASRPHIAVYGCITPTELRSKLTTNELSNGFANRFLIFWAERQGVCPFPQRTPDARVKALAERFVEVIRFGLAGYPHSGESRPLSLTHPAAGLFAELYGQYRKPHPAGELVTGLLERRAPMLLRMAGLFAVTDLSVEIRREHVEAAAAWMDYFAQSATLIFGPMADAEGEAVRNDHAEKLAVFLDERKEWTSRTDIANECFKKKLPKRDLNQAIERLALEGRIERREVDTGGTIKRTDYRTKIPQSPLSARSLESRVIAKSPKTPRLPSAPLNGVDSAATEGEM